MTVTYLSFNESTVAVTKFHCESSKSIAITITNK